MENLFTIIKDRIISGQVYRIAFIGDSITSTEWIHPNWREIVEYVLKEELIKEITKEKPDDQFPWKIPSWQIRCINLGFDGSTSADINELIEKNIPQTDPNYISLVIYLAGDNDRHFDIQPYNFTINISKSIETMKQLGVESIALGTDIPTLSNDFNNMYQPYLKELETLSTMYSTFPLVNLYEDLKNTELNPIFTFISEEGNAVAGIKPGELDILHPNQLGNAYIAKSVLKTIFNIDFDPEKYLLTNNKGLMYPEYET